MLPHHDISINDSSDVARARAAAVQIGETYNIDDATRGLVAFVVTELATNLMRHAEQGRLLVGCHSDEQGAQVDVLSLDRGPGTSDVTGWLRGAEIGNGSAAKGLAAVRRLSTDFSIFSEQGKGTVILSRTWNPAHKAADSRSPAARFAHAGICTCPETRDSVMHGWDVSISEPRATAIVFDGVRWNVLGRSSPHLATQVLREGKGLAPDALLRLALQRIPAESGSVAIARLDANSGRLLLAGTGNICARRVSRRSSDRLKWAGPTDGEEGPDEHEPKPYLWREHSFVILHSAGISDIWRIDTTSSILKCDPAVVAGWVLRDYAVGTEGATIVVFKRH